jgi:hypothetical protein
MKITLSVNDTAFQARLTKLTRNLCDLVKLSLKRNFESGGRPNP